MVLRLKKFKFLDTGLLRKVWFRKQTQVLRYKRIVKLWSRRSCISPNLRLLSLYVHKGNKFNRIKHSKLIFFKKFGEMSFTRKPFYYPNIKKKKK